MREFTLQQVGEMVIAVSKKMKYLQRLLHGPLREGTPLNNRITIVENRLVHIEKMLESQEHTRKETLDTALAEHNKKIEKYMETLITSTQETNRINRRGARWQMISIFIGVVGALILGIINLLKGV